LRISPGSSRNMFRLADCVTLSLVSMIYLYGREWCLVLTYYL
jgi:hypothetical protein